METIVQKVIEVLLAGGPGGMLALFVAIIGGLVWHIKELNRALDKKDERYDALSEKFQGKIDNFVTVLGDIKLVMIEMKASGGGRRRRDDDDDEGECNH